MYCTSGIHKDDVDDVIRVSMEKLKEKYGERYTLHHLVNGYRRFDATRGMEYILDLYLLDSLQGRETVKRVNLVRPVSKVWCLCMVFHN